jgi:hypothetical protein
MSRTGWTATTALALVGLSAALAGFRRYVLGPDIEGPHSASSWRVTLTAEGRLPRGEPSLTLIRPPDSRRQHVFGERFGGRELTARVGRKKASARRQVVWRRASPGEEQLPFRVTYAFRCVLAPRPADEGLRREDHDRAPREGEFLQPTPRVQSDHPRIAARAQALCPSRPAARLLGGGVGALAVRRLFPNNPADDVRALFNHVAGLPGFEPADAPADPARRAARLPASALRCLQSRGGDAGGKSRLLVALCRNRGVPARVVTGLILGAELPVLHYWAEAWVDGAWLPMCPQFHLFGEDALPRNYLTLTAGDTPLFRPRGAVDRLEITVQPPASEGPLGPARAFWGRLSLHTLRPAERTLARFLLLLPLAALIVSIYRTIIGVPTYGTFSPALLGLAFLNLRALPWGLGIFVSIVLLGWVMRHALERFHLLQVPRTSALLTLIVMLLLVLILVASHSGAAATQYVSLFPLVILTHLVERFWTVEAEDGTSSSFKTLLGTMVVSVTVSVALAPERVATWMFNYPETLGGVLAVQLLLGRYTGYRLAELYRFGDLIVEEPEVRGQGSGVSETGTTVAANGAAGDGAPGTANPLTPPGEGGQP